MVGKFSSGRRCVYVAAAVRLAVVPLFKPKTLLNEAQVTGRDVAAASKAQGATGGPLRSILARDWLPPGCKLRI